MNYAKVSDLFMKSLDMGDAYKLIPLDYKLLAPTIADAFNSIPSVLISRETAATGAHTNWVISQL